MMPFFIRPRRSRFMSHKFVVSHAHIFLILVLY